MSYAGDERSPLLPSVSPALKHGSFLSQSPSNLSNHRKNTFVLSQEDTPLSKGHGALTSLIRNRSHSSLHHYGSTWRASGAYDTADLEAGVDHGPPDDMGPGDTPRRSNFDERRLSAILVSPHMRSMRLIGNSNPRYRWQRYWKSDEQLQSMRKPIREYYERTNYLIQQYLFIDRLLDSSVPHDLLNEYNDMPASNFRGVEVPDTISEEPSSGISRSGRNSIAGGSHEGGNGSRHASPVGTPIDSNAGTGSLENGSDSRSLMPSKKVKRTPKDIYRATEDTPVLHPENEAWDDQDGPKPEVPWLEEDQEVDSGDRIVTVLIYVNFAANFILLAGKIAVILSVSSMSVLASLVDATLDFLSTVIVWTTTWLISRHDQYEYPVGRRRLEPIGVLVFGVIMITSFVQVGLESLQRLFGPDHAIIELGLPALCIMLGTVVIKGLCWVWCRLVKNSSVQALADDAMTDVIFNIGSILFPIVGYYARIWWLDALGGLLLSCVVCFNWSRTTGEHIKHLSGFSATADQRNILLYLTMRFAKSIRQIQGLQAYHAGDKLNVEVDIVLDASTPLRDVHDISESLGYVLESVPIVDRAFVHSDYASYNLPTHMEQQQKQIR